MGRKITATILGNVPSKSNCYKIILIKGKPSMGKSSSLAKYEKDFFMQIGKCRGANIDTYFKLTMDVYYPSNRSDLDNSLKVILDCLQKASVIKNDNKCTSIFIRKFIDKMNSRVEIEIEIDR